jgi:TRAP-type transport system periplasmic protein
MKNLILSVTLAVAAFTSSHAAAQAEEIQSRTIRFGHLNAPGHPMSLGALKFAELVKTKSGGKLEVKEFHSSQLGNEQQQLSAMQGGVQEMFAPATTTLAGNVKEFGMLDLPYLVSTPEQAYSLLDGPLVKALVGKLPERGLVGLGFFEIGFRNVTNSKKPVTRPEDLEGMKFRVIQNPVFLETFKALKTNPVPMAFAELYPALEAKAVDGQENPFAVILTSKLNEVQKFASATGHIYTSNIVMVSKRFWDRLSKTEQKILQDAMTEATKYQREVSRVATDKARDELKAKGMQINDIAPAEMARFRSMTQPVWNKFNTEYDPQLVKLFTAELQRIHK